MIPASFATRPYVFSFFTWTRILPVVFGDFPFHSSPMEFFFGKGLTVPGYRSHRNWDLCIQVLFWFLLILAEWCCSTKHPNTLWGSVFEPPNISWGSAFSGFQTLALTSASVKVSEFLYRQHPESAPTVRGCVFLCLFFSGIEFFRQNKAMFVGRWYNMIIKHDRTPPKSKDLLVGGFNPSEKYVCVCVSKMGSLIFQKFSGWK